MTADASPEQPVASVARDDSKPTNQFLEPGIDDTSGFVARVAGAMQSIVSLERVRLANYAEERRRSHLERIRERDAAGVDQLQTLATDERSAIEQWIEAETRRIQQEGERRKQAVQDDLHASLAAHRTTFDAAVDGVETTIAAYRAEVDTFFARLDGVDDPVVIAQHVVKRPMFPTLPEVPEPVRFLGGRGIPRDSDTKGNGQVNAVSASAAEPATRSSGEDDVAEEDAPSVAEAAPPPAAATEEPDAPDASAPAGTPAQASAPDAEAPDAPTTTAQPAQPARVGVLGDADRRDRTGESEQMPAMQGVGVSGLLQRTVAALLPATEAHGRDHARDDVVPVMSSTETDEDCEHCASSRARGAAFCFSCGRDLTARTAASTR